jgi:HD domain
MHTIEGQLALEKVGGVLGDVGRIVRSCHEWFDGNGYPDRLRGEEIPLVARIVCCCDAFSAMTTDRPYRRARRSAEALAELRRLLRNAVRPNRRRGAGRDTREREGEPPRAWDELARSADGSSSRRGLGRKRPLIGTREARRARAAESSAAQVRRDERSRSVRPRLGPGRRERGWQIRLEAARVPLSDPSSWLKHPTGAVCLVTAKGGPADLPSSSALAAISSLDAHASSL